MCGIAGIANLTATTPPDEVRVASMIAMLRHRGPETTSIYLDQRGRVGLGHARLSIIDLAGGLQPLTNEDGTLWTVVNGEFFNYIELADEFLPAGHHLRT